MYDVSLHIAIVQPVLKRSLKLFSVEKLRTKRSVHSLIDTADFSVPATFRLKKANGEKLSSEQTAKVFKEGDGIEIKLGHDGKLNSEFKGFIRRVNLTDPVTVECEGYSWQLRRKAPVKSWKTVKLKEVLQTLIEGTDITIHPDTPEVTLAPFYMGAKNEDALEVLEELKKTEALTAYFIDGNQLFVGQELTATTDKQVIHKLGYNTLDEDELKYRSKDEVKIHVSITYRDAKGKLHHTTAGERGGLEIKYNYGMLTAEQAKTSALREAEKKSYEGYEGKLIATWVPYCQPGWADKLLDPQYKEREQTVIVETVECKLDDRGDWRILELGKVLNKQK